MNNQEEHIQFSLQDTQIIPPITSTPPSPQTTASPPQTTTPPSQSPPQTTTIPPPPPPPQQPTATPPPPPPLQTTTPLSQTAIPQYSFDNNPKIIVNKICDELDTEIFNKKYKMMEDNFFQQLEKNNKLTKELYELRNNYNIDCDINYNKLTRDIYDLKTDYKINSNQITKEIGKLKNNENNKTETEKKIDKQLSIENILEENRLEDLERFIARRKCMNKWNIYMIYFFYVIQSSGILLSSVGASLNYTTILWVGIGLNTLAGILQVFEKANDAQMKKMYKDIMSIKENKYVCETEAIDVVQTQSRPATMRRHQY